MQGGEGKGAQQADFLNNEQRGRAQRELQRQDESRDQVRRYQQRLEDQVQQMPAQGQGQPGRGYAPAGGAGGYGFNAPGEQQVSAEERRRTLNAPAPAGMPTGPAADQPLQVFGKDGARASGPAEVGQAINGSQPGGSVQPQAQTAIVPVALASLDVDLPSTAGYREVLFSTPRGEVEITARPVSKRISERLGRVGWTAVALVLFGLAYLVVRGWGMTILTSRWAAAAMIVLGLVSLLTAVLPLAGLLLAITGFALFVASFVRRAAFMPSV
jgi:hypothetical protein